MPTLNPVTSGQHIIHETPMSNGFPLPNICSLWQEIDPVTPFKVVFANKQWFGLGWKVKQCVRPREQCWLFQPKLASLQMIMQEISARRALHASISESWKSGRAKLKEFAGITRGKSSKRIAVFTNSEINLIVRNLNDPFQHNSQEMIHPPVGGRSIISHKLEWSR